MSSLWLSVTLEVQLILVCIYCFVNFEFEIMETNIMNSILLVNLLKSTIECVYSIMFIINTVMHLDTSVVQNSFEKAAFLHPNFPYY